MLTRLLILCCIVSGTTIDAREPTRLDPPIYCEVYLPRTGGSDKVSGDLIRWDQQTLVIRNVKGERELRWTQITPASAFTLRARLIDKNKAQEWLELGKFGWSV